jgi:hypothetical protein
MAANHLPGVRLWTAGSGDRPGIEGLTYEALEESIGSVGRELKMG